MWNLSVTHVPGIRYCGPHWCKSLTAPLPRQKRTLSWYWKHRCGSQHVTTSNMGDGSKSEIKCKMTALMQLVWSQISDACLPEKKSLRDELVGSRPSIPDEWGTFVKGQGSDTRAT